MVESNSENKNNPQGKTGVVTIIGRPSAGKSTFLNTATGENVSIVSAIPQTTRNAIRGIVNTNWGQLVFTDTPGYHKSDKKLNLKLQQIARDQLQDTDALLYIIDASREYGEEESLIAELVAPFAEKTVVAINKADLPGAKPQEAAKFIQQKLPGIPAQRIFTMSAKEDTGIDDVLRALYSFAPVQPKLYPEEYYTDQEVEFRIAEVIRGEAINRLQDEIPHAVYVDIADAEFKNGGKKLWVRAFLCVERESQKGIVIGKGAAMIKTIRLESLKKLNALFDYKIDLDLQVKVDKNWRQKDHTLNKILK